MSPPEGNKYIILIGAQGKARDMNSKGEYSKQRKPNIYIHFGNVDTKRTETPLFVLVEKRQNTSFWRAGPRMV